MKNRIALVISLFAVLALIAEYIYIYFLFDTTHGNLFDPHIVVGLILVISFFITVSCIIASAISGIIGIIKKKKSVSIWVFLGIFISGAVCSFFFPCIYIILYPPLTRFIYTY
jgi:hypothetical protein